jgi:hypothetical protein
MRSRDCRAVLRFSRLPALSVFLVLALSVAAGVADGQQRLASGALSGTVVDEVASPVAGASIRLVRTDLEVSREATSDAAGAFAVSELSAGLYRVTAVRIGYRQAELPLLRIIEGQTAQIRVMLTRSPTQLSTVTVYATATTIDASTAELTRRLPLVDIGDVPLGRDALSAVELVPGARRGSVWGAGGDAANSYRLDGVAVNHPGVGGDFLAPSMDWIEAIEVRGLGAGAEYGGFQGGLIDVITRSGSNERSSTLGLHYIAPALTASNVRPFEEGAEQSMRRELSGTAAGPIVRDRLLYFVAGQFVDYDVRVPDLTTPAAQDFRAARQEFRNARGLAKLTWLPAAGDRFDALLGQASSRGEHAELDGLVDPAATLRTRAPSTFFSLSYEHAATGGTLNARVAGFDARESRRGYEGHEVPGLHIYSLGRTPIYQNAPFSEEMRPRSVGGTLTWSTRHALLRGENQLVLGAEYNRGSWRHHRTRNGGLTWRPYPTSGFIDPADPSTWSALASEWGGEIRLSARMEDAAAFVQDYFTIRPGLTFTPGVRLELASGWLADANSGAEFRVVSEYALDPRMGVVWDITGRNALVAKVHWGRYRQAMQSSFFDRAAGGNVYTNERLYLQGPAITDPRTVFTPAQRDALQNTSGGFPSNYLETILNEEGRVEGYRQPYVEQLVVGLERTMGPRWKIEALYINRNNRDIAGLVDRNMEQNYSLLENVEVLQRMTFGPVFDHHGQRLVIPRLYVSNADLRNELIFRQSRGLAPVPGYSFLDIATLSFEPDVVLSTIPGARRRFDQLSLSVRTDQAGWDAFASISATYLRGNVPGLTSFGAAGSTFSAGPFVRPNEALNASGILPNSTVLESKVWVSTTLPYGFRGGAFAYFSLGDHLSPQMQISPRFRFLASDGSLLEDETFNRVRGQTILLEKRGNFKYPARTNLDLRLARAFTMPLGEFELTADLFNALGSDAMILQNITVNDQILQDPASTFGAPRRRVNPRALRVGGTVRF